MSFYKPFARARAATLIEVIISQVIALIIIAGLTSLVVVMVKKLNSETNVSDAQIRLRQATHLMLRDTQGIGGDVASAGDLLIVSDGGTSGPDQFTLFKRDESVCGGGLGVDGTPGVVVDISDITLSNGSLGCPVGVAGVCTEAEIQNRRALVIGPSKSVEMTGHNANSSSCKLNFPTGQQQTDIKDAYNLKYDPDENNINGVLNGIGSPMRILFGNSFTYRLSGTNLQRSTDGGTSFETILTDVFDLQVERIYESAGVLTTVTANTGTALPAGLTADNFLGLRIGIITFGKSADGMSVAPPSPFSNRIHASPPGSRRYRGSFFFAAARNRSGA